MEQLLNLFFAIFVTGYIIGLGFAMIFRQTAGASAFTRWYLGGLWRNSMRFIAWCLRSLADLFNQRRR